MRAEVARQAKALILDIARNLRVRPPEGTPVDTGHARRNWVPSVGQPHTGELDDDAAFEAGLAAVLAYKLGDGALYVSNATPYIRALNYGTSKQSPAGFVERAVDQALAKAQSRGADAIDVSELRSAFQDVVGGEGAENLASAYSPFGE